MKPVRFDYVRASSANEAARLLQDTDEAIPIAGGQTLMPLLNMRLARPTLLVDIARAEDLNGVSIDETHVTIGAVTRQLALESHPDIQDVCPLLAKAIPWIGHRATRSRGTIGGSIAFADPAAELPLIAITLGAEINALVNGEARTFAAEEFFEGDMMTALPDKGLIKAVRFPTAMGTIGSGFREIATRHSDFAYASAAVQIDVGDDGRITNARMAIGAVDARPQFLDQFSAGLVDVPANEADVLEMVKDVGSVIVARANPTASADYCRRAAGALLRDALKDAISEVSRHE